MVDPWGKILCEIKEEVGVAIATINEDSIKEYRQSMPVMEHRRPEIYQLMSHLERDELSC